MRGRHGLIASFLALSTTALSMADAAEKSMIAVVPEPQKVLLQPGRFMLKADTAIVFDRQSKETAEWLAARLTTATGYALRLPSRPPQAWEKKVMN